jgi:hypothetical protein
VVNIKSGHTKCAIVQNGENVASEKQEEQTLPLLAPREIAILYFT